MRPETFRPQRAREALLAHFEAASPQALGFEAGDSLTLAPAGALIRYLGDTQKVALPHINRVQRIMRGDSMPLSAQTLKSLEISSALRGQHHGHLLHVLDKAAAMGGRLLKTWVEAPLMDQTRIEARLDCVQALREDLLLLEESGLLLEKVYDVERLLSKLSWPEPGSPGLLGAAPQPGGRAPGPGAAVPLPQQGIREVHNLLSPLPDIAALLSRAIDPEARCCCLMAG